MAVPYAEVIGDPVAHSKSPLIHKFWLGELGLEGDYRAVRVAPTELPDWLAARRGDPDWRGCNVTIPHKLAIMTLLDEVDVQGVGAVNCVVPRAGSLVGHNTDVAGVEEALGDGIEAGAPVCLIGAGGGARAAVAALAGLGVGELRIIVRDPARGRDLLEGVATKGAVFGFESAGEALDGCVGMVNASPLGLAGFPQMPATLLRGLAAIRRGGFVLDMVYGSAKTPLIEQAERAGLRAKDGLAMLTGQAKQAFRYFFGAEAPSDRDGALRRLLAP